jgi:hypothetical protein
VYFDVRVREVLGREHAPAVLPAEIALRSADA